MRRALCLSAALPWIVAWSFFDPFFENVEKGNHAVEGGEAEAAVEHYDEAAEVKPGSPIPDFNRGLAHASQGEVEAARDSFRGAAAASDSAIAADAWYNLGNVHLEAEEFEPAIQAYLSSLDLDPSDADARRNLEIATRRLEEQQQQQQQEQQQSEEQQNEDESDENPQPDASEQPEEPPSDSTGESEQEPQPDEAPAERPEERLSREDAERLLNAIQSDELKVLDQLQDQQEAQGVVEYDW